MLTLIVAFLLCIFCSLFGTVLGAKMAELFNWYPMSIVGPLAALSIGIGFGLKHISPAAGIAAGIVGAVASAIVLWRKDGA